MPEIDVENNVDAQGAGAPPTDSGAMDSAPSSAESSAFDLSTQEKFLFQGKEWNRADFEKALMRQQDYSKKTKELAEERRKIDLQVKEQEKKYKEFIENVDVDIEACLKDPRLVPQFRELYPAAFQAKLDRALMNASYQRPGQSDGQSSGTQGTQGRPARDPYFESRLAQIEQRFQKQEEAANEKAFQAELVANTALLESVCESMDKKYSMADIDSVLGQAEYRVSKMKPEEINKESVTKLMDTLYKQSHELHLNRYKAWQKDAVSKQKQANQRGRDMGAGGGTPADAPKKMKLSDVKHHILANMEK